MIGPSGLNTSFLSPEELEQYGVKDAAQRRILVHRTCVILDFSSIFFGTNVRIDPYCVITCKSLKLGDYVHVSSACAFSGGANITVGDFSAISHQSLIFTSSDDYSGRALSNPMVPNEYSNVHTADVSISRHVILGARTTVLPGLSIGEGAATGAGTLVRRNLDPWMIYVGAPASPMKEREKDCLMLEKELRTAQSREARTK